MTSAIPVVLIVVGALLVLVGLYVSVRDWQIKNRQAGSTGADSAEGVLKAATELLKAISSYPTGQRIIILGIVVLALGVYVQTTSGSGATKSPEATAASASAASR